jgi:SulP family sulfate permease
MYKIGWEQFMPFMVTIIAILLTDLLRGITVGILFGIFYTLRHSYRNSHHLKKVETNENGLTMYRLILAEEVSFFNKASLLNTLTDLPNNCKVIIDCTNSKAIAYDVIEIINDFENNAMTRNIVVEKINFNAHLHEA